MRILSKSLLLLAALLAMVPAEFAPLAAEPAGQVQLPLDVYERLLEQLRDPTRPAPAGFALGSAAVHVDATAVESGTSATVRVELSVEVFEDQWVLVPILPPGTAVGSCTVDGKPVQLLSTAQGLAWATAAVGEHAMVLTYRVDAQRSKRGVTLPMPLPAAAATRIMGVLPGTGLDVAVIPAAGVETSESGQTTRVTATVPATRGLQLSWRLAAERTHAVGRAVYSGRLVGEAVAWAGELDVECFTDEPVVLALLPRTLTLTDVRIDGAAASILLEDHDFATTVRGKGRHRVSVDFEVAVQREGGSPRIDLAVPQIPISRFELRLPGDKQVEVTPAASVASRFEDDTTIATVNVPMTGRVGFAWSEAIPEELRTEVRSNASIYHLAHAEEGVLSMRGLVHYEITRGETNVIELLLPPGVEINRIASASGIVADWRTGEIEDGGGRRVSVFLDRRLQGELKFEVLYDSSLGERDTSAGVELPLLRVVGVQRERGMVALLSDSELTLGPVGEPDATRVGENRLPAFVRESTQLTVAHTYKYAETPPRMLVQAAPPVHEQGRFDAQVDTLVSLGDVTVRSAASVEIHVKSGRIMTLDLKLPAGASLLDLTAPALRTHEVDTDDPRRVRVEFTQEMEGRFRVDLNYERIVREAGADLLVDTVQVADAEVQQGRIAIEASSAVEVTALETSELTGLDVAELPRRMVLRTTHPILLAYKYVAVDPPHRLALGVTRHAAIGVQEAVIDRADYRTLFTEDGLQVTTARLVVRNGRKQFLRLDLPAESDVWSVFVDGKPAKPALAESAEGDAPAILVKILNSTEGFPVEIVYATRGSRLGLAGRVSGSLPRPDVLVTTTRWDVYFPDGVRYGDPATDLDPVTSARRVTAAQMDREMAGLERSTAVQPTDSLRVTVPATGMHYAFEKLYANQGGQDSRVSFLYLSGAGATLGNAGSLAGAALLWVGLGLALRRRIAPALSAGVTGVVLLALTLGAFQLAARPPVVLFLLVGLVVLLRHARRLAAALRPPLPEPGAGRSI